MAEFVFATCLPGVEPAVKREVARTRPELRFAYSRPGLVTFKSPRPIAPEDPPGSVFARVWGRSVGSARDVEGAGALLAPLGVQRVHVFARDPDETLDLASWQGLGPGGPSTEGELVADVIVAPAHVDAGREARSAHATATRPTRASSPTRASGPRQANPTPVSATQTPAPAASPIPSGAVEAWLGVHRHDRSRPPHPGGAIPVDVPADAPSRAYAKIEEAIAWARLPVAAGQVAVEIGAAPGGAVLALARRGLTVHGVDTGELAPVVRALPNVHHIAKKVGAVRWEELPERVDWLLVDVNLAPQVALHEVARLMPHLRSTLRGAVITLKLNDWAFVDELPTLADRIRAMGFPDVGLRHLPSNRREICAVALT